MRPLFLTNFFQNNQDKDHPDIDQGKSGKTGFKHGRSKRLQSFKTGLQTQSDHDSIVFFPLPLILMATLISINIH